MIGFGSILKDYLEFHNITQTDFADRLGISFKHMNEIINGNTRISQDLMIAISLLTDIDVKLIFFVEHKKDVYDYLYKRFKDEKEIKKFLNTFYIKEMYEKGWITLRDKTSVVQNAVDLLDFMQVKDFDVFEKYVNKRILYKKKDDANQNKIYLWLTHCDKLIDKTDLKEYSSKNLDNLFEELKRESNKSFDKDSLIKLFKSYGIILCIEDALKGTKVRGCSMVKGNHPVIYLTTYFKEKSSLYFTLYHELSHIKSDYNRLMNKIIIDEEIETKADRFALDKMIGNKVWNEIINNMNNKAKICKRENIPLTFLYSRLAYEGYIKYDSIEYNKNIEKIEI